MSGLRTRIAPTPSGYLHAGNALNFLLTHQLAREEGGTLLLRIDDLDSERVRPEYVQDIFDSLHWLGITWDEGPRNAVDFRQNWSQTLRTDEANAYLTGLKDTGHLYACTCSRRQVTDCRCRDIDAPFDGPDTAWRLRIPDPCLVRLKGWPIGEVRVDLRSQMRDPVLRQRNGSPAYQLASLADDTRYGMTLIVRGEDLLPSSVCQVHLAGLLGLHSFPDVRFLHHPLIVDGNGRKLSKSEGASSLRAMQSTGGTANGLHDRAANLLTLIRAQGC
jgi:glutamyl/glutaminyl-tRNA synthetase